MKNTNLSAAIALVVLPLVKTVEDLAELTHLVDVDPIPVTRGGILSHRINDTGAAGIEDEGRKLRIPLFHFSPILHLRFREDIPPHDPRGTLNIESGFKEKDVLVSPQGSHAGAIGLDVGTLKLELPFSHQLLESLL